MKTRVVKIANAQKGAADIQAAAKLIKNGDIVAFPTETVYGLGADAMNDSAVAKIFTAKERPADNPLIVHIADRDQLLSVVKEIPIVAERLMDMFWPGPLSLVLPKNPNIPDITTGGLDTVVIRYPSHPVARALIRAAGFPIAAPSANLSGKLSPTKAAHVIEDLNERIPLIIDGGDIEFGLESTVVDCTANPPVILRPGSVTYEVLRLVIPDIQVAKQNSKIKSPGMKYRHYSPNAPIILFTGETNQTTQAIDEYLQKHSDKTCGVLWHTGDFKGMKHNFRLSTDPEKPASSLFDTLRLADHREVDQLLIQGYDQSGVGVAIMNRLEKAASEIIRV